MKFYRGFLFIFFSLFVMFSNNSFATNTQLIKGDSFFPSVVDKVGWKKRGKNFVEFYYFCNALNLMNCGYSGIEKLKILNPTNSMVEFVNLALSEKMKLLERKNKNNKRKASVIILIYPKGYNPSKYGFFRRYNKALTAKDIDGGGVFVKYTKKEMKLASKVPSLKFQKAKEVSKGGHSFNIAVVKNIQNIDIYAIVDYVPMNIDWNEIESEESMQKWLAKAQSFFEHYANGRKGLKVLRWRNGKIKRLVHSGSLWKEKK